MNTLLIRRCFFIFIVGLFSQQLAAQTVIPEFLQAKASAPEPVAKAWALLESKTGWIIAASNENNRVDPASLTKLMTSYLTFEALGSGKLKASDKVFISKKSWNTPGSRMFLEVDTSATIEQLIKGLIIQSGNDAAVALAEHLGGSEAGFAKLMNEKAAELGMLNTHYINASGLPDKQHYTTALDTAILSREIIQAFPDMYALFAVREYTYNEITQANRNGLLDRNNGYDGLKTGHTKAAGYCLAGSAARGNSRFIAVVMGAESKKSRVQAVGSLIEYGFSHYETVTVFGQNTPAQTIALYKGELEQAEVGSSAEVSVVVPKGEQQALNIQYKFTDKVVAPLIMTDIVGQAELKFKDNVLGHVQLTPLQEYKKGSLWVQLVDTIKMKIDFNLNLDFDFLK